MFPTVNFQYRLLYILILLVSNLPIVKTQSNTDQGIQTIYQHSGKFPTVRSSKAFNGVKVLPLEIFEDTTKSFDISEIHNNKLKIKWNSAEDIIPTDKADYWLKTKIAGTPNFNGEQIFHVSETISDDVTSFDYVTTYTTNKDGSLDKQITGDHITLKKRPLEFWATFIKLNIPLDDTLDVYIKLEGINPTHPMKTINLWHIDMFSLFPNQIYRAIKAGLFFGILGIQIFFFFCLFLIEKDRIHLYFTALIVGLFMINATGNLHRFSMFPFWIDHHASIYFIGVYIAELGGLFFFKNYLNYGSESIFSKKLIPYFLTVAAIDTLIIVILGYQYDFHEFRGTYLIPNTLLVGVVCVLVGLMIVMAKHESWQYKKPLIFSFAPLILSVLIVIFSDSLPQEFIYKGFSHDFLNVAIIWMLVLLALSIGYRTNRLKAEKTFALEQNLLNKQAIREKELQAEQLKEIDQLKSQLYTNITHEFRTPLTVILGMNDENIIKIKNLKIKDNFKQHLINGQQLIRRNGNTLLNLVNQLLTISKSDKGLLQLQLIQNDVIPYLNYLTESFYSVAREKDIRLVFYSEVNSLYMDYDEDKLQQIVFNILSNALKFTPQKGKVIFHAQSIKEGSKEYLLLKITDNGSGIPSDKLNKVFDRFYQVEHSSTRSGEGTGIGLALTKNLVDMMEGTISVESVEEQGTTFFINLPITRNAKMQHDTQMSNQTMLSIDKIEDGLLEYSVNETTTINPDKPLLLLVEDNRDVKFFIRQIFAEDYQIIEANNGEEGVLKALEFIPELIVSDVMMPKKDGFELTEILKSDSRTSHIPIILLTAKATYQDKIDGLKVGADAYLNKPFSKEELKVRVSNLLESRKVIQQYFSLDTGNENQSDVADSDLALIKIEDVFVANLNQIINDNIDNPTLDTTFLCKSIGISQSQLYRKIKAITNETPSSYIRKIRLKKAKELLTNTGYNISEVAYAVGFNDPNYFSRVFHKQYGQSPTLYRN